MKENIEKIVNKIVSKYSDKSLGIILFGSAIRGNFDKFSDIDFYVLQKDKPMYSRENFVLSGLRVDVTIDSLKDAIKFLNEERGSVRRNFSHMLANGKIVYSKGNNISMLQKKAVAILKGKTKNDREAIIMHLYSIEDFYGEVLRFAAKKDYFSFEQNCSLLINNIIECFLRMNKEYFRRPNELPEIFAAKDNFFAKLIDKYYKSRTISERSKILGELVSYTYKISGGPLPAIWKVK